MIHRIGNDFTKSIHLNLLPGIKLARGYWQADVRYTTIDPNANMAFNHGTFNHGGEPKDFNVIVGQDVREISFMCYRHNSYPGYPNTYIKYTLRVDRILLLNFVYHLVGSTIKI